MEVSVTYLIDKTDLQPDKEAVRWLEDKTSLPESKIKFVLDLLILPLRELNAKQAYIS